MRALYSNTFIILYTVYLDLYEIFFLLKWFFFIEPYFPLKENPNHLHRCKSYRGQHKNQDIAEQTKCSYLFPILNMKQQRTLQDDL